MLSNVDNNMTVISRTRHGKFVFLNENTAVCRGPCSPRYSGLFHKGRWSAV